ncbi:large ribosomal subunit protein mL49 [Ciconia boyciana]|uniref:large ribosomal subunit protein mL49 n=1 Tax=Ciconia boyciana TaxID=52775 RepID=UPI003BA17F3E
MPSPLQGLPGRLPAPQGLSGPPRTRRVPTTPAHPQALTAAPQHPNNSPGSLKVPQTLPGPTLAAASPQRLLSRRGPRRGKEGSAHAPGLGGGSGVLTSCVRAAAGRRWCCQDGGDGNAGPAVVGPRPGGGVEGSADPPPALPYFVRRSRLHNLPVYHRLAKGNRRLTELRHVEGDIWALERELRAFLGGLGVKELEVQVNEVTGSLLLKGHWAQELRSWLLQRGF